jgi:hypothetical protein
MKNNFFLLLLSLFISSKILCQQQLPIKVEVLDETYQELDSTAINVLTDSSNINGFSFTIEQAINIFGEAIDSFFSIENEFNYLSIGKKNSQEFDVLCPIFLPLDNNNNEQFPYSISYKIAGEIGKRILTIQWKNFFAEEQIDFDFVNYQVRIDEESETVDYIYGPSSNNIDEVLALDNLPTIIGIFDNQKNTDEENVDVFFIGGSLLNPKLKYQEDVLDASEFVGPFPRYPRQNTLIRFSKNSVSTHNVSKDNTRLKENKVTDKLEILSDLHILSISIANQSGQTVYQNQNVFGNITLDVSNLGKGIYFTNVVLNNGTNKVLKFLKI